LRQLRQLTHKGIQETIRTTLMRYRIVLAEATRVSFDFDGTLETKRGQEIAKNELEAGNDVWIITARDISDSRPVLKIADTLGIPHSKVVFTNGEDKWKYMIRYRIAKHYDNNAEQIKKINKHTNTKGIIF
jgi:hydroxymethylpyrimidine pyrophosphatase-like HAD family hydrolase